VLSDGKIDGTADQQEWEGSRMTAKVNRRNFLKTASATVGMLAYATEGSLPAPAEEKPAAAGEPTISILSQVPYKPGADYPIQAKEFTKVRLKDNFWQPKMKINAEVTIPFEVQKAHEREQPIPINVLQAAIYSLQTYPDPKIQIEVDNAVKRLRNAEVAQPTTRNDSFEVAVAYYEATGRRDLLDPAISIADRIYDVQKKDNPPFSGGERDAINCLQLYRATHDKKYLDLAKNYLDIRGRADSVNRGRHNQSYEPVLEQSEAVGHAVNGVTFMLSLLEVGMLTGLTDYSDAAERLWNDTVRTKLYVTGGVGCTGNEGFGPAYSLPNLSAYSETCAAAMYSTFSHRMFLASGDAKYIDVMERTMYNNLVDGVSVSGDHFFYVNRLASAGDGRDVRWERASLECCPPNLARFLASMPGYIYAQKSHDLYINLYISSEADFQVDGRDLGLAVESEMPWDGRSKITITKSDNIKAALKLRIPGWLRNRPLPGDLYTDLDGSNSEAALSVNGAPVKLDVDVLGYVTLDRAWKSGDVVELTFPMEIRKIQADGKVKNDRGRMAVARGPIVFCAEWPEYEGGRILTLLVDPQSEMKAVFDPKFFGGATVIRTQGRQISMPRSEMHPLTLIPYHLWANRGAGEMAVWLSTQDYAIGDIGPAGGIIFYVNKNNADDGWRFLEAAPFDQSAGAPWGSFRIPIAGAYGHAVGAGKQNTLDILASCKTHGTAADLCAGFAVHGIRDWYLPSVDELALLYDNLAATGIVDFGDRGVADNYDYWSSTQATTDMARHRDFADNGDRDHYDDKDYPRRVRAIRSF
jgi:hypothetical protein